MPSHPDRVRANYSLSIPWEALKRDIGVYVEHKPDGVHVTRLMPVQLFEQSYIDILRYNYEQARDLFERTTGHKPTYIRIEVY